MPEPIRPDQADHDGGTPARRPDRRTVLAGAASVGIGGLFAPPGWKPKPGGRFHALQLPPGLTNQQLAGQRVIYSYPGLTPPATLLNALKAGTAAGVIFFGENISSASQIAGVVTQLRQAAAQSPVKFPPLLMTDQEGGLVRRLPGAPTQSAKQIGQSANPATAAASAGTGAGQNLKSVGMNVNLAPVLDVFYTAGDFIDQFQRSFSNSPATVTTCAKNFVTAQQATGVAATAKHFPGLGSATASQNTDTGPVTLNVSLNQLHTIDEVPYPAVIAAGAKLVMVSWAVYPALDPNLPAGLSPTVIGQELRSRNAFRGATITDALEAGALNAFGSTSQRAVSAAAAGMDLILCSARDVSQGQSATSALAAALGSGQLDRTTFIGAANQAVALRSELF